MIHWWRILFCGITFTALMLPAVVRAEEQSSTFQLYGISHPEREADLKQILQMIPAISDYQLNQSGDHITLTYEPLELFAPQEQEQLRKKLPIPAEKTEQKLKELISQSSRNTFELLPAAEFSEEQFTRIEIPINPLDCKACRFAVYSYIAKVPGVVRAKISTEPSLLTAWIDGSQTSHEALLKILTDKNVPLPEDGAEAAP